MINGRGSLPRASRGGYFPVRVTTQSTSTRAATPGPPKAEEAASPDDGPRGRRFTLPT